MINKIHYFWAGPCTYENTQKVNVWQRNLWMWDSEKDLKFEKTSDLIIRDAKSICDSLDLGIIQELINRKLYAAAADYFRYLVLSKVGGLWMDYADTEVLVPGYVLSDFIRSYEKIDIFTLVSNDYPYNTNKIIPLNSVIYNDKDHTYFTVISELYNFLRRVASNDMKKFDIILSNAWGLMDLLAFFMQDIHLTTFELLSRSVFIGNKDSKSRLNLCRVTERKNKEAYWSDLVDSKKDLPYIPFSGLFLNQPFQRFLRKVLGRKLSIELYFKFITLRHKLFRRMLRRNKIYSW